jgi:hypothetical protein
VKWVKVNCNDNKKVEGIGKRKWPAPAKFGLSGQDPAVSLKVSFRPDTIYARGYRSMGYEIQAFITVITANSAMHI